MSFTNVAMSFTELPRLCDWGMILAVTLGLGCLERLVRQLSEEIVRQRVVDTENKNCCFSEDAWRGAVGGWQNA